MDKDNKASWSYLANQYNRLVKIPCRPCRAQLGFWNKAIKKYKKIKGRQALILGATPELRDLALKNGFFTWAVDINPAMMAGMTQLMEFANPQQEKRIVGDWLKVKLPKNFFDLIMADASLNNLLSDRDSRRFFEVIYQSLKSDGICLLRNVVTHSVKHPTAIQYWIDQVNKRKLTNPSDFTVVVRADSSASPFIRSPQLVDSIKVYKSILKEKFDTRLPIKNFLDFYYQVLGKEHKYLFIYLKSDFEKMLRKYFIILSIDRCQEHYSCRTIFLSYLLKKK